MFKSKSREAIMVLWLMTTAVPAGAESSLSGLAESATDSSISADVFMQDANAQVLRLLQHDPTEEDLAAIPGLIDAYHRAGTDRQGNILKVLAHLLQNSEKHRAAILGIAVTALESMSTDVRVAALDVLGRSRDPAVVPQLISGLSDTDWDARYQALYGLSFFVEQEGSEEIFEAIAPLVEDKNERVRVMARSLMRQGAGD